MAAACGLSPATVQRVWRAFGLKPHRVESVQALLRPRVRREGPGHRRPLPRPARPGLGAVRGREDRDAGPRAHPAGAADAPGAAGAAHLGLPPARHLVPVRRPGRGGRQGDRPLLPPAPGRGVPRLPRRRGRRRAGRAGGARGPGQRLDPQGAPDPGLARQAAALPPPLHADRQLLAEPGRALLRPADRPPAQARHAPLGRGAGGGGAGLRRAAQRRAEAVPLDQVGRRRSSPASAASASAPSRCTGQI